MILEKSAISIDESKTRFAGREFSDSTEKALVEAPRAGNRRPSQHFASATHSNCFVPRAELPEAAKTRKTQFKTR